MSAILNAIDLKSTVASANCVFNFWDDYILGLYDYCDTKNCEAAGI
jgi:hypothetical protein